MDEVLEIRAHAFEIAAHALQVAPQALLNPGGTALQGSGKIAVLQAQALAKIGVHPVGMVLRRRLKFGHGAQKTDLRLGQFLFPAGAPFAPMPAQIAGLKLHLAPRFGLRPQPPAEFDQRAIDVVDGLDGGVHRGHGMAVELDLFAHVPVERPRHQLLPPLKQGVQRAAAARVYGADGGHFPQGGVARMHQGHQIRKWHLHPAGSGLRVARAHPVAHRAQDENQLSAFHVSGSRSPSRRCSNRRAG
ncbi:MAG: hypothetical protein ABSH56_14910 [Bryobacteraceae bacterium]